MSKHHGRFVWYELMTTDAPAAEAFYREVVGWGARNAGHPGMDYTLLMVGDQDVGGLMTLPQEARAMGAKPGWNGYVAVDDVDVYTGKVTQAGGTVHVPPTDIPNIGRFAMVADPQGAVFTLFKGSADMADQPVPGSGSTGPGTVGWRELMAGDGPAAFDFYSGLFGWTKDQAMDMGAMGVYQLFAYGPGDEAVGGMMTKAPMEVPGGIWVVQALDPQGAMFSLLGPKS